eukprot:TRINITY_DN11228_c0_g1_i1.p3 TRINITY_DN11228_c0_g1~~TRINITY_DN11228_c0_g1_i1.p3  ORF type:complete len:106 (-),score=4.15 TRINITY_DN11228_c0_g1_i1:186-503(-)
MLCTMFDKEDQGLVRFLPYVSLSAVSALLSMFTNMIASGHDFFCPNGCQGAVPGFVADALDSGPLVFSVIFAPSIGAIVMSFVAFRSPSVRRLVAYHAVQVRDFH